MNQKKNKIDRHKIDDNNIIGTLQDKLRDQEASGVFTYQNEFIKSLNLLGQLFTKNNSKKLKDDIN